MTPPEWTADAPKVAGRYEVRERRRPRGMPANILLPSTLVDVEVGKDRLRFSVSLWLGPEQYEWRGPLAQGGAGE